MTSYAVETNPRAVGVKVTDDELVVHLADGRVISVPLVWFPRVLHASSDERAQFRVIGEGEYIYWPSLDEDLSVAGLLRGTRAVLSPGT
jgi:hypothetical protein